MLGAFALMAAYQQTSFRPPAIPLIAHDPYFSVWSFNDRLTDDWTKHWTGKNQALCGMIRVDGRTYRWISRGLDGVPTVAEQAVSVGFRTTVASFVAGPVSCRVVFVDPGQISDPASLAWPISTVAFEARSKDEKEHTVEWYFDVSGEIAVDRDDQEVTWSRLRVGGRDALSIGCDDQKVLGKTGDDLRIDWGRAYLVPFDGGQTVVGPSETTRSAFAKEGRLPISDDLRQPRSVDDDWPVMAWSATIHVAPEAKLLSVGLGYDDLFSIQYFFRDLQPIWRSQGIGLAEVIQQSADHAKESLAQGLLLDRAATESLTGRFGPEYADLATIAFRQCLAAHKIVRDIDGTLLMFPKENFSNGCISTVDVIYPACPIFLAYNPALLKANMEPVMEYASMPRWKWPFAPHDLGTYPKANGQVYGGAELTEQNQMPVEESGNMLIMAAAYLEKSNDKAWIQKYWGKFTQWAEYLKQYGVDPGNQLCTDDFAGHLAHNANLSVKAIVAMACYGRMAQALGQKEVAEQWTRLAKGFANEWMKMADDGDHYRLAFDKPGTWSQKYNLVWDKVMNLGLFPKDVYDKEVAWYLKHQNDFGLPLDNRATYTKLDWTVWTACLASSRSDFEAIMAPLYKWMNATPDRIPLTDWFDTKTAKCVGFRARSVVGGIFMPLLLRHD